MKTTDIILTAIRSTSERLPNMRAIADVRSTSGLSRDEFSRGVRELQLADIVSLSGANSNSVLRTPAERDGEQGCHWLSMS